MNKKTFIKKLKNNLSVLDESEVNDMDCQQFIVQIKCGEIYTA